MILGRVFECIQSGSGQEALEVRIYLDNCCFNRPFDDQRQARIRLEAEAKLYIQEQARIGALEVAWSYILELENDANPFEERRGTIAEWKVLAKVDQEETQAILNMARALSNWGIKPKDTLHIACAITAQCQYFITTDDQILRQRSRIDEVTIVDPLTFIREVNL